MKVYVLSAGERNERMRIVSIHQSFESACQKAEKMIADGKVSFPGSWRQCGKEDEVYAYWEGGCDIIEVSAEQVEW